MGVDRTPDRASARLDASSATTAGPAIATTSPCSGGPLARVRAAAASGSAMPTRRTSPSPAGRQQQAVGTASD